MPTLTFDRHCAEIVAQADALAGTIAGADLTAPVPGCPGWDVGQLLRHLGGGLRWAEVIVRTRATAPPPDEHFRKVEGGGDPAVLGPWVAAGARQLAATLRDAGPDATMWTPVPGRTAEFYARRFAHETVVHRADAALALGAEFALEPEVAVDGVDEWLELGSLPQMLELFPERRELLGPGRTLHLHATDAPEELHAEWVVDLTETLAWRRAHEKAAVAVRGPLTDLLLLVYRRRGLDGAGLEVFGDRALLELWLARVAFG
ncbi:MAG TPA: maleylpyruvate isomerase family mycothiol-dependent enzyme [Geodermatophilus sp.]|nr:maleylpyruvate isomerase family mycothiol-dependent enzyme [Geodermatophilus sp.]